MLDGLGVLDGLDSVDWRGLEVLDQRRSAAEVPKVLRRIGRADATTRREAVDRAYGDLQDLLVPTERVTDASTAALPFLVELALDPDTVARPDLIDLLAQLARGGAAGEGDPGWPAAWHRQWPRLRGLFGDPDPAIRRAALQLIADRTADLLERWRAEEDRSVRLTLLPALGEAAAAEDPAGGLVAEVRAVLDGVLDGEDRVLRVAAVIAAALLDPRAPLRAVPMLLELLTDPALAPEFEALPWYALDHEYPYGRDDVAGWVVRLLGRDPAVAASFVAGLAAAGAADRTGDAGLRRCALDEGWWLLVERPGTAAALLPVAAGMLADPDDDVRYKAVHLLAVLGRRAAPYADRLAALLDDPGESEFFDGTVGDLAAWALTRIGDPRALPGLVERLVAPYRDMQGRGYCPSDPRRPDVVDVLRPLRAHAALLLPAVREALRDEVARQGWLVRELREVLQAWGEDPLLPGEEAPYPPAWQPPPMDAGQAEAAVLEFAAGGERYGDFHTALASLTGQGRRPAPAVRAALVALRDADRRLSPYRDYRAFLGDEEMRPAIEAVLALP
ncbi:HEAT repeat domain-containing protein [Streptomyces goshikiensis]|uniref:HEAT repeat domain-containing protein n=1 Tax=Streptomyces goshikiensis TaxID=1942 RepID=UPI003648447B